MTLVQRKEPKAKYQNSHHDPIKYNWGQVIHSNPPKTATSYGLSSTYNNKTQENKKNAIHTVCVDWFESTIQGKISLDIVEAIYPLNDSIVLENRFTRTKHYAQSFNVWIDGERFGILLTDPYETKNIIADRMNFKVENEMLYRSDWLETYKYFLNTNGWKHYSNTRIDIAIDGANKASKYALRALNSSVICKKGKASFGYREQSNQVNRVEIGSMRSDKFGRLYNKSVLLAKDDNKPYINQFWNENGLNQDSDVWRYEIAMRSKIANIYDWTKFDDSQYLASIARTESKNWFEFYYNGKDKNKHRKYKNGTMEVFNWDSINGDLIPKPKARPVSDIFAAKTTVKHLSKEQYNKPDIDNTETIERHIECYDLREWYERKRDYWTIDWERENRLKELSTPSLN